MGMEEEWSGIMSGNDCLHVDQPAVTMNVNPQELKDYFHEVLYGIEKIFQEKCLQPAVSPNGLLPLQELAYYQGKHPRGAVLELETALYNTVQNLPDLECVGDLSDEVET